MTNNTFNAFRTLRPGIACVEASLDGFAYPAHSHDHVCVGLMLDGEKSSLYGLKRYTVRLGDVVLVNPGEVHDGQPSGWSGRRYAMLEIEPATFEGLCRDAVGSDELEFEQPVLRDSRVRKALASWLAALKDTDVLAEREAATRLLGVLHAKRNRTPDAPAGGDLAANIRDRMRDTRAEGDSIGELAKEFGASRYQLLRAFKQAYGLTPEDFRRQLRVESARSLLPGRQRLADVAAEAGFSDQSHMNREFRRLVGMTPAAYRQALQ